jgi:uncharacterized 2Fe-2S/4Fe-4S cluster protein (DUF4445 family)
MTVSVPQETRFFEQVVLTEGEAAEYSLLPSVSKRFVSVPAPSVEDQRSDADRLKAAVAQAEGTREEALHIKLPVMRSLPALMRDGTRGVTVVRRGELIQSVEPGDTTRRIWGMAFDVGTTTLVGTLLDLHDGSARAVAARTNPQVAFGDDVVSRIRYVQTEREGLERLRKRLLTCLNEMVLELCGAASIEPEHVYEATIVGNTTMSHILLGVDPSPVAQAPYVAVVREAVDLEAQDAGLDINPHANVHVLPNMAGFVGSDTVAMVLAGGLRRHDKVQLAIDIGTNGEVVIGNRERLLACSCAAGPAFEGARIRHGMRAAEGAISKVVINESIEAAVIGGGRASGICGSGLVDAVAELLRLRLLDPTGRIVTPAEAGPDLPPGLHGVVVDFEGQPAVVLVDAEHSKTREPILLTQRDVRELQLAKAAIRSGVQIVAQEFGIAPEDVSRVLLAGGFGNFIRRSNAKRIGLLPAVSTGKIDCIGNAALAGAKAALASSACREEAERISRETQYVELAGRADFQACFSDALLFPEAPSC